MTLAGCAPNAMTCRAHTRGRTLGDRSLMASIAQQAGLLKPKSVAKWCRGAEVTGISADGS
jgi:hypothetical protein